MNISFLSENVCDELDPLISNITLVKENPITDELQLSFIFECYDWDNFSYEAYNSGTLTKRYFEVQCINCIESTLAVGRFSDISLSDNHPLLFKYNLPHVQLYFSSTPDNPYEVLGRIAEAHRTTYQDWRPMSDCINENIIETLSQGIGLFAQGPKIIMDEYYLATSDLLRLQVIENNYSKNYQLLLFSSGYIIFSDVSVVELHDEQWNVKIL
ncbi:MAG: hypothetical protein P4L79_00020 [Legionella sp.]|uniref:hypothetical protein n=1 Tax=Legionella sp. TaxID=459 RepID=UPI002843520A|nr:hypothetical protein [Legionella sp.]